MTITKLYLIGHGDETGCVEFRDKNKVLCSGIHSYSIVEDTLKIIVGNQLHKLTEGTYRNNGKDVLTLDDELELDYIQLQRNVQVVLPGGIICDKEISIVQYGSGQSFAIFKSWRLQQSVIINQYNDSVIYGGNMTTKTLYTNQRIKGRISDIQVEETATFFKHNESWLELTKKQGAKIHDGDKNEMFNKICSDDGMVVVEIVQ